MTADAQQQYLQLPEKQRFQVLLGLALAVLLDTGVQLVWKGLVREAPPELGEVEFLSFLLRRPTVFLLISLFVFQFFNWMFVLTRADLSFAQPFTALSYIFVCFGSHVLFHDHIPPLRLLGIALILVGVFFVSRSDHNTQLNQPSEDSAVVDTGVKPRNSSDEKRGNET